MTQDTPVQYLDLRTTKCPLNFVKTRLALEKLSVGDVLEVCIQVEGQSALNIPQSIRQEGHCIVGEPVVNGNEQRLQIRKMH